MSEFYSKRLNSFGTASIPKLVLQFSVPAIISMCVNALYNIVDRYYVGQGVGSLGIAGITLCFPICLFIMALSMMVGVGGNTLFAIRLGQKKYLQASIILNNSFSLLIIMAVLAFTFGEIFMTPLLKLFGASEQTLPVAESYMRILLCGAVFQTIAPGMNHFIRSMGHPKTAMFREIVGAVSNIILDWLFIMKFHWGIEGGGMGYNLFTTNRKRFDNAVFREEILAHQDSLTPHEVASPLRSKNLHLGPPAIRDANLQQSHERYSGLEPHDLRQHKP